MSAATLATPATDARPGTTEIGEFIDPNSEVPYADDPPVPVGDYLDPEGVPRGAGAIKGKALAIEHFDRCVASESERLMDR